MSYSPKESNMKLCVQRICNKRNWAHQKQCILHCDTMKQFATYWTLDILEYISILNQRKMADIRQIIFLNASSKWNSS